MIDMIDLSLVAPEVHHVIQAVKGMNLEGFIPLKEPLLDLGLEVRRIRIDRGQCRGHPTMPRPNET